MCMLLGPQFRGSQSSPSQLGFRLLMGFRIVPVAANALAQPDHSDSFVSCGVCRPARQCMHSYNSTVFDVPSVTSAMLREPRYMNTPLMTGLSLFQRSDTQGVPG